MTKKISGRRSGGGSAVAFSEIRILLCGFRMPERAIGCGLICSRSLETKLSHMGPQGARVHAKKLGRSPLPFDSPSRFLQNTEDVVPLHLGKAP